MRFDIHLFRIREVRHVVQTIFSRAIGGGAWEALGSRSGYGAHDASYGVFVAASFVVAVVPTVFELQLVAVVDLIVVVVVVT